MKESGGMQNNHIIELNNVFKGWRIVSIKFGGDSYYKYEVTLTKLFRSKVVEFNTRDSGMEIK